MLCAPVRLMAMQGGDGSGGGWDPSRQSHPQYDQGQPHPGAQQQGYGQQPGQPQSGQQHPGQPQAGQPQPGQPQQGYGPPGGQPPPGAPPPGGAAKKPNMGMIIGGGVGALAVVGGGIAAFMMLSGPPALPVGLTQLPGDTQSVSRISLEGIGRDLALDSGDVPDEARWSAMSQVFCGGEDVFERLLEADDDYGAERLGEILSDRDDVKATLACGKAVAEEFGKKGALYRVSFKRGKDVHAVTLAKLGLDELPESTKRLKSQKDPDNFEKSRCLLDADEESKKKKKAPDDDDDDEKKDEDEDDKKCRRVYAKLAKEDVWAEGKLASLKEFGKEFSPEGKNKLDNMELFEKTLNAQKGERIQVGLGDKGSALYTLPFVKDEELKEKAEKLVKDVKVFGVSTSYDGPFSTEVVTLVLGSESDAKDLTEFLEKYLREAKRQQKEENEKADEREEKKKDKDSEEDKTPKERKKFKDAMRKVRLAALEEAKAEQKGDTVIVTIAQKSDDSAKEAWKALNEYTKERATKAAAIVNKLMEGEKPDDADLKALGDKVLEAINPPEWVDLEGFGFQVPGGGSCRKSGSEGGTSSCRYKKLTKDEVMKKLKESLEKAGYTLAKQEFSESLFDITKGDKKFELFVMGDGDEPASLMFSKPK